MAAHWRTPAGLHTSSARLPVEGRLPTFDGATGWLNSPPLTMADVHGKVTLVSFWTYTCINWLRQLPYLRAWAGKYAGHNLVVIGVHTPEFGFEHDLANVRRAVRDMRIGYPVAIDNDYAVWSAFARSYASPEVSSTGPSRSRSSIQVPRSTHSPSDKGFTMTDRGLWPFVLARAAARREAATAIFV